MRDWVHIYLTSLLISNENRKIRVILILENRKRAISGISGRWKADGIKLTTKQAKKKQLIE